MTDFNKLYYINVGKGGTFQPSSDAKYDTTAADIDALFDSLRNQNRKKLLVYFHGGLVNVASGIEIAERIHRYTTKGSGSHPICFVWETGLKETFEQNLNKVGGSSFFKKLLVKIIKVAGRNLGIDIPISGITSRNVGAMTDAEIEHQMQKPEPFENVHINTGKRSATLNATPASVQNEAYYENIVKPEVQAQIETEIQNDPALIQLALSDKPDKDISLTDGDIPLKSKGIISMAMLIKAAVKITIEVIKRHMRKRDHGFYPTIVEEIFREYYVSNLGIYFWGSMKNKAKMMWKEDDFSNDPVNWHVGSYFLKKLDEYKSEAGELTVDVIGHSAGSIAICEMVKMVSKNYQKLFFRNIIFMAPACRCDLFADTILKHQHIFKNFRSFTMSDEFEKKDHLVPFLYPRSLLYLISGILEEGASDAYILGMQRYLNGQFPYKGDSVLDQIHQFLKEENRVVYAVTEQNANEGLRSTAKKHGSFDDDMELTLDSIIYLVNQ